MMPHLDANIIALLLIATWFIWQAFKHKQFQWLWFSVILWLVLGLFSARLLPNVLGITHSANLFLLPTYLFSGSIFFFLNTIQRQPENQKRFQSRIHAPALTLFAVSNVCIHLAFATLAAMLYSLYPEGLSAYLSAFWARLYFDPINWCALLLFLMLLFALHRTISHERRDVFSWAQLKLGFFISLLWLCAAHYALLLQLFKR